MAAAGSSQPNRPKAPRAAAPPPLQVMKINRKEVQEQLQREAAEARAVAEAAAEKARLLEEKAGLVGPPRTAPADADEERFDMGAMEGMTMADLMGAPEQSPRRQNESKTRSVDDFDPNMYDVYRPGAGTGKAIHIAEVEEDFIKMTNLEEARPEWEKNYNHFKTNCAHGSGCKERAASTILASVVQGQRDRVLRLVAM